MENKLIENNDDLKILNIESNDDTHNKEVVKFLVERITKDFNITFGLTSNMYGIHDCKVAVVYAKNFPIYLINPQIVLRSVETIKTVETNPLFPDTVFDTYRHLYVDVKCDNLKAVHRFGVNKDKPADEMDFFEGIYVQQTIDLLNNKLPSESSNKQIDLKLGRNEFLTIIKDSEEKKIKYKHLKHWMDNDWTIKE